MISYIKTHYPDTYKDFNQSSFGSMMLDLVSYVDAREAACDDQSSDGDSVVSAYSC